MSAAVVEKLIDAGLDAHAILAALKAFEAVEEERKAAKREGNRERQARRRAREDDASRVTSRDNALPSVTERDTPAPFLPSPPDPPSPPTPTPENNTPTRKARSAKPAEHPSLEAVWTAATPASRNRSGRDDANLALIAALEAGATVEAVIASVRENCRTGGDHAKGLHRIINAKLWRDHAPSREPPSGPVNPQIEAGRRLHFQKTGEWRPDWGPRPSIPHQDKEAA